MFYIIQICCFSCYEFISFKICNCDDYNSFIKNNFDDYNSYNYLIFDSNNKIVAIIDNDLCEIDVEKFYYFKKHLDIS